MPSRFIHVATNDRISFFFKIEPYFSVCVCINFPELFICWQIDRHLGCFPTPVIVINAAVKMGL